MVATVSIVKEEEVAPAAIEGEEPAEPEVIGKGKKEEEGDEDGKDSGIADCRFECPIFRLVVSRDNLHTSLQLQAMSNQQSAIRNRTIAMNLIVGLGNPGEERVVST